MQAEGAFRGGDSDEYKFISVHDSDKDLYPSLEPESISEIHLVHKLKPGMKLEARGSYVDSEGQIQVTPAQHYIIDKRLAEGGMGTAFVVRKEILLPDEDSGPEYGAELVMKVLTFDDNYEDEFRERFLREIRSQVFATQRGDGLCVPVDDVVTISIPDTDKTKIAIIMKYVEDGDLSSLLDDLKMTNREHEVNESFIGSVGLGIASALATLHERGLVHRDIKPENIFINKKSFHILLGDFGLAKLIEDIETNDQEFVRMKESPDLKKRVTQYEEFIGTLEYISPVALKGKEDPMVADLYALGMTLFHMRTGSYPHPEEEYADKIMKAKLFKEQRRISDIVGYTSKEEIFDRLIDTMVAKERVDREKVIIDGVEYMLDTAEHIRDSIEALMKKHGIKKLSSEFKDL